MHFSKRSFMILSVLMLLAAAFSAPVAFAQDEETSTGCVAFDNLESLSNGSLAITFGPEELFEGETINITVTGGDLDAIFSVTVNTVLVSENNTIGNTVSYPIPADDIYTFVVDVTSIGTVTAVITLGCDPVEDEDDGNGKVTICHFPPGNPDNAKTLSVGAPAVDAHVGNHGDTIGACPQELESEIPDSENGLVIVVLDESGIIEIYGNCDDDSCSVIVTIIVGELAPIEGGEFLFDDDLTDEYSVIVYYLGYQDRDGDGESADVYQINIYRVGEVFPVNDNVLILIKDDGTIIWDTNNNPSPRE